MTVPETAFLVTSICKKDGNEGSDDPAAVSASINAALADAQIYKQLTLDQRLEIARREMEG